VYKDYLSPIEEVIEDARNGKMFILVDAEDRENEGDLVIPAQMCTPEAVNFMAKYGRGLVCLTLTGDRAKQLNLQFMSMNNQSRNQTAFTVSIEASRQVSRRMTGRTPFPLPSIRQRVPTTSSRPAMCFRSSRAMAVCWSAQVIPKPPSISRVSPGFIPQASFAKS